MSASSTGEGASTTTSAGRKGTTTESKRTLILAAARRVFEAEGLDGASLRAIASEAGYTPAALYFHFDCKEAIYAALLSASLARLLDAIEVRLAAASRPEERLRAAATAFFDFYVDNPRDLDLGFYLFRGGMKPSGLGRERDAMLNDRLSAALRPIADAAQALGASEREADLLTVDVFAHAAGLLLLSHTGRIRMFDASASALMADYVDARIRSFGTG